MDSGIAAILGALVGALGTGGAALVTGLWGARTAERQSAAQDVQARRQLRVEHARERRGPRSAAYADFIGQARVIERALGRYRESPTLDMDQFCLEIDKLDYLGVQVWLEGPSVVVPPSQELISCASRCIRPLRASVAAAQSFGEASPEYADAKNAVATAGFAFLAQVQRFAEVARRVLDDEGVGDEPEALVGGAPTPVPAPSAGDVEERTTPRRSP